MSDLHNQLDAAAQSHGPAAQDIERLVEESDRRGLLALVETMESIDLATKVDELSDEYLRSLLDLLPSPTIALLAKNADEPLRLRIATALDDQLLLVVLALMQNDDVVDVLGALSPARASSLLAHMREADRVVLTSLLQYPDETAGSIMTIVSGMGGNAGSQTMAIVVRHLSRDNVSVRDARRSLGKEIAAGIINGAANGLLTGIVVAIMYHNAFLPVIVLIAMMGNMVIAGTFGFLVPVALKACHQDPAVSSSIFVTTATDVLGFFIFLGMAQLFLPLLR